MPIKAGGTAFVHKLDSLKVVSARSSGNLVSLFGTIVDLAWWRLISTPQTRTAGGTSETSTVSSCCLAFQPLLAVCFVVATNYVRPGDAIYSIPNGSAGLLN
jgi:hypothetical protein